MTSKMNHFEGLRGLCCMIVIVDHCINGFAGWIRYNGPDAPLWQQIVASTPLSIAYSGIASVYIFFLMSAFVISIGYFKYGASYLPSAAIRRIPRLVLPCMGAAVFFYLCSEIAVLFGHQSDGAVLPRLLKEAYFSAPFLGEIRFNWPLWTITWEIYGSFLVFAILGFFGGSRIFLPVCAVLAVWYVNSNYLPFVLGMAACWVFYSRAIDVSSLMPKALLNVICAALVAIALVFLAYPYPRDGVIIPGHMGFMSWTGDWNFDYRNNVMAGAVIIFLVVCIWPPIQGLLARKGFVWLGKVSFSAYLIHQPVIILVNAIVKDGGAGDVGMVALKMALVFAVTLLVSIVFERYVDRGAVRLSSVFSKWALAR